MSKLNLNQLNILKIHTPHISSADLLRLRKYFGSYENVAKAPVKELEKAGLNEKQVLSIVENKANLDRVVEVIKRNNIQIIDIDNPVYPVLLREIPDPPAVLYMRGQLIPDEMCLSIVGSRKCSSYGKAVASDVAQYIASHSITVVSGLAYGIDSIAHRATLQAKGRTIAVLAHGLEHIYPPSHRGLAEEIIGQGGAIVSEYPIYAPIHKTNFLVRNRIIAGISKGTVIVEANLKSGALVTAKLAAEYNRDIFVVPGSIYSELSQGSMAIQKDKAYLLYKLEVIAEEYRLEPVDAKPNINLDEIEQEIIRQIPKTGIHLDQLAEQVTLDFGTLSSKVIMLEIKGAISNQGAGVYRRLI